MAGTAAWPFAQKDNTHTLSQANDWQDQAAAGWKDTGCSELASGPTSANVDNETPTDPRQAEKLINAFLAKYSYYVTSFQYLAYFEFEAVYLDTSPKPEDPDETLRTPRDLLSALDLLETLKDCHEDYAKDFINIYGWVKPAWEGIVEDLGLSCSDFAALREFQMYSYERLPILDDEGGPMQALTELESGTVPGGLQVLKEPLARLLRILAELTI